MERSIEVLHESALPRFGREVRCLSNTPARTCGGLPTAAAGSVPNSIKDNERRKRARAENKPIRRVMWGRRFLAATVVVPPSVAEHLNIDLLAVLAVIRDEAKATGKCTLPLARIAERANIGRAKARAAIRLAESLGAIAIEEAPGRKRVFVNRCVTSRC
jgi:hypothetical protein